MEDEEGRGGNELFFVSLCRRLLGAKKSLFLLLQRPLCAATRLARLSECLPRVSGVDLLGLSLVCGCVSVGLQLVCFKVKRMRSSSSLGSLIARTEDTEHNSQLAMMNLMQLAALNTKATNSLPPQFHPPKVCSAPPSHLHDLPPPPSPPKLLHSLHRHGLIPYPLLQEPLQIPPKRLRLQHRPPTQPLRHYRPTPNNPPLLNHPPTSSTPLLLLNRSTPSPNLPNHPRPPPHNHNPQLQPFPPTPRHIPAGGSNHLPQTPRIRNRLLIQQQFNLLNWDPRLIGDRELDVQSRGRGERERGEG